MNDVLLPRGNHKFIYPQFGSVLVFGVTDIGIDTQTDAKTKRM